MNYKFRVNSPEHSKEIQNALFDLGYDWRMGGDKTYRHVYDEFLFCDDVHTYRNKSISFCSTEEFFVNNENTEAWIVNGKIVTVHPASLPKETIQPKEVVKSPLGLRPKHIVDSERTAEILQAMFRYNSDNIAIPSEWLTELINIMNFEKEVQ